MELAGSSELNLKEAEKVVEIFFDTIVTGLRNDERAELRGFGSFTVRSYSAYMGRNPKSGQAIEVRPKKMPIFKAGKALRLKVDSMTGQEESSSDNQSAAENE
jgi:integration host factor subunit beta